MKNLKKNLARKGLLGRFARDQQGVAAAEFAYILPMLLTFFMIFAQLSRLDMFHSRVGDTAATINDIVAKLPQISTAALDSSMRAGMAIAGDMGDQIRLTVVGVNVDSNGVATVMWSRGRNMQIPQPGTQYPLPNPLTQAEGFIVATHAEFDFDWSPVDWAKMKPVPIKYDYYHVPRSSDITDCIGCNI